MLKAELQRLDFKVFRVSRLSAKTCRGRLYDKEGAKVVEILHSLEPDEIKVLLAKIVEFYKANWEILTQAFGTGVVIWFD